MPSGHGASNLAPWPGVLYIHSTPCADIYLSIEIARGASVAKKVFSENSLLSLDRLNPMIYDNKQLEIISDEKE